MPRKHKDNNLFTIDLEAIERVLEDANSPMLSQAEQIISKAIEYPNEINENAEAEELKSFLAQLRLQTKRVTQARLSDGRPFSDASQVVKAWFGKTEDRLKTADKRISNILSQYASALHAQAAEIRRRNEDKQRLLREEVQKEDIPIIQATSGESIISANPPRSFRIQELENNLEEEPEIPSVPLVWQVRDYDINRLDIEKLRNHFSESAIKNAIKSHIKQHGPNQITGVEYDQTVARKLSITAGIESIEMLGDEQNNPENITKVASEDLLDQKMLKFVQSCVNSSETWLELNGKLIEQNIFFKPSGGGIILATYSTKKKICKGSEIGLPYLHLMKKYKQAHPDHTHDWLVEKYL